MPLCHVIRQLSGWGREGGRGELRYEVAVLSLEATVWVGEGGREGGVKI